ncbi:outer membrane protein assembly factor BamB family protein [Lysobacter sp. D1-1-M9]|uniref:outer membrane protein assembly factor BamB family protein n=2 Tax=Novilysobacter TaxID=3382699 RepID=UPI0039832B60
MATRVVGTAAVMLMLAGAGLWYTVEAAAAKPGDVLWKYRTGGAIWAPLTHADGVLYVGSDDHHLHAVDLATRRALWTFETGGPVRSKPLVVAGRVYLSSDDGLLYALDASTGQEHWRFELEPDSVPRELPAAGSTAYDYLQSAPIHADGLVYVGSASGRMHALDAASGKELWRFATDGAIRGNPLVGGGALYFGSWDHGVYSLDAKTGERRWHYDTQGIVQSTPALGDGKLVIGSRSAKLFALDAATGTEAWTHVYSDGSWVESSAVYADGAFYIGSSDSLKLSAFDAGSGEETWAFDTGGWAWSTPVLSNGVAYIGGLSAFPYYFDGVTLEPGFFAVDAETGQEKWRFMPEPVKGYVTGGVMAAPEVHDGTVYVGALDGHVYALQE